MPFIKKKREKLVAIKSIKTKIYTLITGILKVWYQPSYQKVEKN